MKTWAYRIGLDLALPTPQAQKVADQLIGWPPVVGKMLALIAFFIEAWWQPTPDLAWGQWVLTVVAIDMLYQPRTRHVAAIAMGTPAQLLRTALVFAGFWWVILAGGIALVSGAWWQAVGGGGLLAGFVGVVSYARHRQAQAVRQSKPHLSWPLRRWIYHRLLGVAVIDQTYVNRADIELGMALVGLKLIAWGQLVVALLQAQRPDGLLNLGVSVGLLYLVQHRVTQTGLDEAIYHDVHRFEHRRRQLQRWRIVQIGGWALAFGLLAWWLHTDGVMIVIESAFGAAIGDQIYQQKRAKIFLSAKRT